MAKENKKPEDGKKKERKPREVCNAHAEKTRGMKTGHEFIRFPKFSINDKRTIISVEVTRECVWCGKAEKSKGKPINFTVKEVQEFLASNKL